MKSAFAAWIFTLQFSALLVPYSVFANGNDGRIQLDFRNNALSAHIEDAPLPAVIAEIKEEQNIWVKGMQRLPQREYSVEFENIPLTEGLERILSPINHCLVFDSDGALEGIVILSSPSASTRVSKKKSIRSPVDAKKKKDRERYLNRLKRLRSRSRGR